MRHMRRCQKTQPVPAEIENLVVIQAPRWTVGIIIQHDHVADHAARGLSLRRHAQPFVQRATFIRLEMTETDPAQLCRVDNPCYGVTSYVEHFSEAGVHQKRLFVLNQKLIEFNLVGGDESRDAINVRRDLVDVCFHLELLSIKITVWLVSARALQATDRRSDRARGNCGRWSPRPACRLSTAPDRGSVDHWRVSVRRAP